MNDTKINPYFLDDWLSSQGLSIVGGVVPIRGTAYRGFKRLEEILTRHAGYAWFGVEELQKHADRHIGTAVDESIPRGDRAVIAVIELHRLEWVPLLHAEDGEAVPCRTGLELAHAAEDTLKEVYRKYGYAVLTKLLE